MASILLTGATGLVGGATAFELLRDERVHRLVLLVRAEHDEHALQRVRQSVGRFGELRGLEKVTIVRGDLATPLAPAMLDSITHVLHAAACTSFRSTRRVFETNVEGSLAFARQCVGRPRLQRFLAVSTTSRCGDVTEAVVRDDTPPAATHVVEYARSKAMAEAALAALTGLPLLIARPSSVVGHTALGVSASTSLFWYYLALARAGVSPFPDERRRDIVPVDYVARALVHLLFLSSPAHHAFHISAGEGAARPWGELRRALGGPPSARVVPPAQLGALALWEHERLAAAVALTAKFALMRADCFDNSRLLASGLSAPPPFPSYAARCLETARGSLLEMLDDDA
jgi:nucleoside-diphosphate-sugar epimerase